MNNESPLVFIHGIKGSKLTDLNSNKTDWLTLGQALAFSTPDLRLPLQWKDGQQLKDSHIPAEPLGKITLVPGIIEVKNYSGILEVAPKKYKYFFPFSYDWRRSNLESLSEYLVFLRNIVQKYKKPVKVIAHSMGGLLTLAAMQKEPELFDTVFFVGVPFNGGIGFLEDLHPGTATGLNRKILSPEVLASMPSVYSLFPLNATNELLDGNKSIRVDFFEPQSWSELKIGPFAHEFAYKEQFQKYFPRALEEAKIFRKSLIEGKLLSAGKILTKQPKVFVIAGKSLVTLNQVIRNGPKSTYGWDFQSAAKEPGDGRVSAKNAYPPAGIEYKEFESKFEHSALLNDPAVLDFIFSIK
jgi:pimeloyl-ACP methyl ester carboxylesterase